jgi:thymidylate synthase (FAD)
MAVRLEWITPDADQSIGFMARVSNINAGPDDAVDKLIQYLIDHKHWSPFEMACACVEITTTRDIGRQILRHRSFHFQEFSQRYAKVLPEPVFREVRLQDKKNRQNSTKTEDMDLHGRWSMLQGEAWDMCHRMYRAAIDLGIAKEVARALLPEGMVQTKMYMQGTIRDWLHYLSVRTGDETQLEHRIVARGIQETLEQHCPVVFGAAKNAGLLRA